LYCPHRAKYKYNDKTDCPDTIAAQDFTISGQAPAQRHTQPEFTFAGIGIAFFRPLFEHSFHFLTLCFGAGRMPKCQNCPALNFCVPPEGKPKKRHTFFPRWSYCQPHTEPVAVPVANLGHTMAGI
jgi:hypothetical protein